MKKYFEFFRGRGILCIILLLITLSNFITIYIKIRKKKTFFLLQNFQFQNIIGIAIFYSFHFLKMNRIELNEIYNPMYQMCKQVLSPFSSKFKVLSHKSGTRLPNCSTGNRYRLIPNLPVNLFLASAISLTHRRQTFSMNYRRLPN